METQGTVYGIFITKEEGAPVHGVDQVEAVPGVGLLGDRYYFKQLDRAPDARKPESELTLVEWESVVMLNSKAEYGLVEPGDLRRNLVTKNIRLNELVGKRFTIGGVLAEGIELCEPCSHLEKLTGKKLMKPLVHKAGLRARILQGGLITKGDELTVSAE